jgi:hypothetical protein
MKSSKLFFIGLLLLVLANRFDQPVVGSSDEGSFDPDKLVMEDTGLVVSGNRIGVGLSVPSTSIDVFGSVFIQNTITYDKVDRGPYSVDWTQGNCQRLVITEDGAIGINMTTPPTMNAHLVLSIQYDAETPGQLSISATSPDVITWNLGVSQNTPISHNIDVIHFYFQKGSSISTYNGVATFSYRTDPVI